MHASAAESTRAVLPALVFAWGDALSNRFVYQSEVAADDRMAGSRRSPGRRMQGKFMADQPPTNIDAEMRRLRLSERSPLIDGIGEFLSALSTVHSMWLGTAEGLPESQKRLYRLRGEVKGLINSEVIPPPGLTPTQFAAEMLNLVEEAGHLSRFVLSISPSADPNKTEERNTEERRLRDQIHERMPAIHDELRKNWLHLKHVASLEASGLSNKPTGNPVPTMEVTTPVELSQEDKAIALAVKDQELSVADIAEKLGVDRKTPYRWPEFKGIWNTLQKGRAGSPPPHGSKDREGNLEAEDDSE